MLLCRIIYIKRRFGQVQFNVELSIVIVRCRPSAVFKGGGPGAVVKAACLESRRSRIGTPLWSSSFKETIMFLPRSLVKILYCEEPPRTIGSYVDDERQSTCYCRAYIIHKYTTENNCLLSHFNGYGVHR